MKRLALILSLVAGSASGQEVTNGPGVMLRGLDKIDGFHSDIEIRAGQSASFGQLNIELQSCRYPAGNPAGDAFAYLVIRENDAATPIYSGWMIASSPALNALDHARYDVWVMRCTTS